MNICPRCLEKDLRQKYSGQFADAALSQAHQIMLKDKIGYKRLYTLNYKHEHTFKLKFNSQIHSFKYRHSLTFKLLFWLCNIFDSYHHMEIQRVELAERLINIGEVKWLVMIPNTVMSYRWLDWHQYKLEENPEFYGV